MIPSDPRVVGRRVGGTLLFYRINSLTTPLTQRGEHPCGMCGVSPTLLPVEAGGCMFIGQTYTPPPEAEAAILPLLPPALRAQALRLLAQLLEHGCYTEKASPAEAGQSQVGFEGSRQRASRDGHGWQDLGAFLSAELPSS